MTHAASMLALSWAFLLGFWQGYWATVRRSPAFWLLMATLAAVAVFA